MDSVILSRIAMVGWLFLVVFIGSLWSTDSPAWQRLVGFLHEKDSSVIAIGVVGALAGVATPPALGFLMERVVTLILIATNRSVTVYPQVKNFKESLASEPKPNLQKLTGEGVFHVYLCSRQSAELEPATCGAGLCLSYRRASSFRRADLRPNRGSVL